MRDRTAVQCRDCGRVYSARNLDEGGFLVPTDDGGCQCGATEFVAVVSASNAEGRRIAD